ncbi:MAG: hypothetical protein QXY45_01475 [Candidatus Aenigmatarchaeota archaeon]
MEDEPLTLIILSLASGESRIYFIALCHSLTKFISSKKMYFFPSIIESENLIISIISLKSLKGSHEKYSVLFGSTPLIYQILDKKFQKCSLSNLPRTNYHFVLFFESVF